MTVKELHAELEAMPISDRVSALIVSVVDRDPYRVQAVHALIAMAGLTAGYLGPAEKTYLARLMVEEANKLDPHVVPEPGLRN
jgi:hypothetical protein